MSNNATNESANEVPAILTSIEALRAFQLEKANQYGCAGSMSKRDHVKILLACLRETGLVQFEDGDIPALILFLEQSGGHFFNASAMRQALFERDAKAGGGKSAKELLQEELERLGGI